MPSSFTRVKIKGRVPVRKASLGVVNEDRAFELPSLKITLKKTQPGDFYLSDFDGTTDDTGTTDLFTSSGFSDVYFNTVGTSGWVRDTGSTTT